MGYLDNSSVVVDAILTKRGRELLSRQDGSFRITQFALADDEIDYTLYNENHPNGSAFYGEAIENLPLLEAIPNETNTMVSKLITLNRGTTQIPIITTQGLQPIGTNTPFTIVPTTLNFGATSVESSYSFTISDRRLLKSAGTGGNNEATVFTGTALSQTFIGTTFQGTTLSSQTLFGSNSALNTSIIIVGTDTGARTTVTLTVTKVPGGNSQAPATT
jgi:hypothetical protein